MQILVDFSTSTEEKSKIFISHRKNLPKLKTDRAKFLTCFLYATNTRSIAVEKLKASLMKSDLFHTGYIVPKGKTLQFNSPESGGSN